MNVPHGTPEWLVKALDNLEEKAEQKVRAGGDHAWAAGYFSCVKDLKDELDTEAAVDGAQRRQRYEEIVGGKRAAS